MLIEQRIRLILFYLSVAIFLTGLPFILTVALGYKFDRRTLKFTKTGLIVIKTQPPGAAIYFSGRLLTDKTPHTIAELLPGSYPLRLELEKHYPWEAQVPVEANKVTRLEKVILFPLRPHITRVNVENITHYWIEEKQKAVYYVDQDAGVIYRSDPEGAHFEAIGTFVDLRPPAVKWKVSPDEKKLLYFNTRQAGIASLGTRRGEAAAGSFVIDSLEEPITDLFWHSDSFHIVLVSDKNIEVFEAAPGAAPVAITGLNRKRTAAFYDTESDALYFSDFERAADGRMYNNLYRVDLKLNAPFFELPEFMKSNETKPRDKKTP